MANNLGKLVVLLGLDAAEFTRGLTKAEYEAQRFAKNTRAAILEVGKTLAGLEIGRQVFENTKAIIEEAASLNDLSDATGSSVESLSRLSNQAKISGTDFGTLQSLVLKLSAGMAGVDDESSKVGAAFKALGVTATDPVEALQQVAVALNGYADGTSKAAIAVALFGKQGPAFLATLKDIAELQDVGATVTAKQAAEAKNLEKAYRRLSVESRGFANAILNDLVPALTHMIEDMKEGTKIAGGFFQAILTFGTLNPFDTPAEGIKKLRGEIDQLKADKLAGKDLFGDLGPEIALREKQLEFLKLKQRQAALALIDPSNNDARDFQAARKPTLNFSLPKDAAKATKEAISEAERYRDSLEKQLQATFDLTEAEKAEVAIYDLRQKAISGLTPEIEAQIRDYAQQIQAAKDAKDAQDALRRSEEEASRIRARISQDNTRAVEQAMREAESIRDQNDGLREQLEFLKGGEDGLRKYTDAKLAKVIAEKEDLIASLANVEGNEKMIEAIREQVNALKDRQAILKETDFAAQMKKEAQALQDVKNMFADTFANAFADFVSGTKSAKDAFRSFVDDLSRQITRIASQNLANALFGGTNTAGPDFFGVLAKFAGGLFGGFSFGGGGGGVPGVGFSGGGFGEHFASGGISRGGLALVGEHGPELVGLRAGTRVYSAPETKRMFGRPRNEVSVPIVINAYGNQSTQSLRQIRAAARDGVMAGVRDR